MVPHTKGGGPRDNGELPILGTTESMLLSGREISQRKKIDVEGMLPGEKIL